MKPRIYIGGPMIFESNADRILEEMKGILIEYDMEGIAPLDNQIGLEECPPGRSLAHSIYNADEQLMRIVDGAIFNIDPFRRGTEMDPGTAFEVGFCKAFNLPMVGWTSDPRPYPEKVCDFMLEQFGSELQCLDKRGSGATSGELRDQDGVLVHSQGMYQNLMIEVAIEKVGGKVYSDKRGLIAFRKACEHLQTLVREQACHAAANR